MWLEYFNLPHIVNYLILDWNSELIVKVLLLCIGLKGEPLVNDSLR